MCYTLLQLIIISYIESICHCVYLSIYLSIYLSTYLASYPSIYLPTYLPIYLSIYLSICTYYIYIYYITIEYQYSPTRNSPFRVFLILPNRGRTFFWGTSPQPIKLVISRLHSFRSLNEDGLEGSQKLQGPHSANTPSDQS